MIPKRKNSQTSITPKLNLYTIEKPWSEVVTLLYLIHTGTRYEEKENAGALHLLEHAMLHGSKKLPKKQLLSKILDPRGAILKGSTNYSSMRFTLTVPTDSFDSEILDLLTDIVFSPALSKQSITVEKKVISEERMRTNNSKAEMARLLLAKVAPNSYLAQSILGTDSTLNKLTRSKLTEIHENNVTNNKIDLIYVGGRNVLDIEKLVMNQLPRLSSAVNKQSIPQVKFEPILNNDKIPATHNNLLVGYFMASNSLKTDIILSLLVIMLTSHYNAILKNIFRNQHGFAYKINSTWYNLDNYIAFFVFTQSSKLQSLYVTLGETISLLEKYISEELVESAKLHYVNRLKIHYEQTAYEAESIATHLNYYEKPYLIDQLEKIIETIRIEDVHEVVNKLFVEQNKAIITS